MQKFFCILFYTKQEKLDDNMSGYLCDWICFIDEKFEEILYKKLEIKFYKLRKLISNNHLIIELIITNFYYISWFICVISYNSICSFIYLKFKIKLQNILLSLDKKTGSFTYMIYIYYISTKIFYVSWS